MMFGGVVMLLFWLGLIALGVFAFWAFLSGRPGGGSTELFSSGRRTALDILKERYARGEISKEQYDEMRRDLET
jgi:putative membrane protein